MKKRYFCLWAAVVCAALPAAPATGAEPAKTDVLALEAMPDGRYSVTLELKQLDGKPATVELTAKDGRLTTDGADHPRLGRVEGRSQLVGNGVFIVFLSGSGYRATQHWVFKPDGSAVVREIPDRGEKQVAKRVDKNQPAD